MSTLSYCWIKKIIIFNNILIKITAHFKYMAEVDPMERFRWKKEEEFILVDVGAVVLTEEEEGIIPRKLILEILEGLSVIIEVDDSVLEINVFWLVDLFVAADYWFVGIFEVDDNVFSIEVGSIVEVDDSVLEIQYFILQ